MAFRKWAPAAWLAALTLLVAAPTAAQSSDREHGYVMGIGGMTATTINTGTFGGSVGFNVTRDLQITGGFGRLQNLVPNFTRDDLTALDQMITREGFGTFKTQFKMPGNYLTGGIRYKIPTTGAVRPYVSGGGGMTWLQPEPKFLMEGEDNTNALLASINTDPLAKAEYDNMFSDRTRPLVSVGGGVSTTIARHFTFDVGYEYSRLFIKTTYVQAPPADNTLGIPSSPHDHSGINVHRLVFGVGYAF